MDLTGIKAVVTGGASGLGNATARFLAASGAQVVLLDRDTVRGTEQAAEIGAGFQECDVTDEGSVQTALSAAAAHMGGLTAAINCAGIATAEKTLGRNGPHGLDSWKRTIDINLTGSFNVGRLAAEIMSKNASDADGQRGVIVNTASIAAFEGQKGQAAYAASKGGIAALALPMARDLASVGVRCMAIAPGIFRTPMLESLGQEVMDGLAADVTFPKRLGDPQEYARTVGFILTCPYLNGSVIRIDGALRMP
ncbi:SDR family NAD(P)-dependent oxidoreductase [Donghicola sp. C2-DW-16]|uniref:SDR family NAD(P)-dependent oxidoreductase n=1 Tax=Donghicola mangrovi TaxID=2729614 RepID=A0ABX2PBR5_9RHOB|nr:SDR family NAD(P)-dependent oxidoreductase [Donghicola mangrovi]NVO26823.1 SDR family NAD(P)-dependent oxidoreductase [Donghicola mangrovi]